MEDIELRYQLVMLELGGRQHFNVYEVAVSKTTGDVVHVIDPEPVQLTGESVDEVMNILQSVHRDIKHYGVLTQKHVEDSVRNSEVPELEDSEVDDEEDTSDVTDREYEEDDLIEMMDQEWDEDGNVLDLVDFMNKKR